MGEIELVADALELPGEDLTLIVYTAQADSLAQERLDFLARWSTGPVEPHHVTRGEADGHTHTR